MSVSDLIAQYAPSVEPILFPHDPAIKVYVKHPASHGAERKLMSAAQDFAKAMLAEKRISGSAIAAKVPEFQSLTEDDFLTAYRLKASLYENPEFTRPWLASDVEALNLCLAPSLVGWLENQIQVRRAKFLADATFGVVIEQKKDTSDPITSSG